MILKQLIFDSSSLHEDLLQSHEIIDANSPFLQIAELSWQLISRENVNSFCRFGKKSRKCIWLDNYSDVSMAPTLSERRYLFEAMTIRPSLCVLKFIDKATILSATFRKCKQNLRQKQILDTFLCNFRGNCDKSDVMWKVITIWYLKI